MCGFGSQGDGGANDARIAEYKRTNAINSGMSNIDATFAPFNDAYYKDYAAKQIALATPDIEKQAVDARTQALYGLARSGNSTGSAAGKAYGDISDRTVAAKLQANNAAQDAANALRGDVEGARSNLVNQLEVSADPGRAGAGAVSQAAFLTHPPVYSPVTNIFSDLTGQFATASQKANSLTGNPFAYGSLPIFNPGGSDKGSGKSVVQV